jgi:hypothetical protein
MPSTVTDGMSWWRACWKPRTAASVSGPKIPPTDSPLLGSPDRLRKLELLLHPADGVALAALLDGDDQRRPGVGADDAVDGQALLLLEGPDGGVGVGAEDAVHGDSVATGPEQVLQGVDRMLLVTLADEGKGTDRAGGHRLLLVEADNRGGSTSGRWVDTSVLHTSGSSL